MDLCFFFNDTATTEIYTLSLHDALPIFGVLGASQAAAVDAADEFLERVRATLHLTSGRDGDRLRLEDQPSIAAEMGFTDEPGLPAVDALMRQVFEHARQVEHVATAAFSRTLADEVAVVALEPTPAGVLRALVDAVGRGDGAFPASLLDRIDAASIPD